jgi:hypothetical protein
MPSAFSPIRVDVAFPPSHRGGTGSPPVPRTFWAQSGNYTNAWGSEPATAELVYVGGTSPVTVGYWLTVRIAGHVLQGLCKSDTGVTSSSGGIKRTLRFVDFREYLDWDNAYCAFNKISERIVNGKRERRYMHLLPANYRAWYWTYTNTPYTAAQIMDYLFGSETTEDVWSRIYHTDQLAYPVYDIDCQSGMRLKAVLQEIADRQGLTFSILPQNAANVNLGDAFRLVWARKGDGIIPSFTSDSDDREYGLSLTDYPTRVRVLGDRNQYQVANITMEKDWKDAWEDFYDFQLFAQDIYDRAAITADLTITKPDGNPEIFLSGTLYSDIGGSDADPEKLVTWQMVYARASTMTLREYVSMRNTAVSGEGDPFADYRKFSGRGRMDMPCKLYIENILFRAFRIPDSFTFVNAAGLTVAASSVRIADKMIANVTHDPATGVMTHDTSQNHDGNGYAIVQGYNVMQDLFRTIQPERFNLSEWVNAQDIWEHVEFQIDDSGEEQAQFIMFRDAVIRSSDLIEKDETLTNGYAVFRANPTFSVPNVKVTLTLEAEKYSYVSGTGTRDEFENVNGLYGEYVCDTQTSTPVEVAFADGLYADDKADEIAASLLSRQNVLAKGSFKRHIVPNANGTWPAGTQLTGIIDRVSMVASPSGYEESISLTTEIPRRTYVPLRDLERQTKQKTLLPGQKELQTLSNQHRMYAMALKGDPAARKTLGDVLRGYIGGGARIEMVPL